MTDVLSAAAHHALLVHAVVVHLAATVSLQAVEVLLGTAGLAVELEGAGAIVAAVGGLTVA